MATATASSYLREAKSVHAGVNWAYGEYTATLSTGDILKCFKVPTGAAIVDCFLYISGAGGDNIMRIRDYSADGSSTTSAGFNLVTASAAGTVRMSGIPQVVSASDSATVRYFDIEVSNASASTTGVIKFGVAYTLDHYG